MIKIVTAIFLMTFPFFVKANEPVNLPKVVVSIKPIHSIVANIADGVFEPVLLVDGSASPHSFSLRPTDAKNIYDSDVIILASKDLEAFLNKPLESYNKNKKIIELVNIEGIKLYDIRGGDSEHSESEHHHHGEYDPHVWLLPKNAIFIANEILNVLVEIDPVNTPKYSNNFIKFVVKSNGFDEELSALLKERSDTPFVVFHDAFQYFERRYNLKNAGAITVPATGSIGAKRLRELEKVINEKKVACIFTEPQFSSNTIKNIFGDKVRINSLDPIGYEIPAGKDAYFDILRSLANNYNDCLKG